MDAVMMQIVVDENGTMIYDSEGRVCLQSEENDENSDMLMQSTEDANTSVNEARGDDSRAHWTRRNILRLISAYKEHQNLFRSNSVKNSEAWNRVAADVPGFSSKQCEAKFKYLKSLYKKSKNNMGNKSSGARPIYFEYYEELDEIFHHEITAAAIASSSSTAEMEGHSNTTPTDEVAATRPSKRKRTRLEIQLDKFQRNMELREEARERRMNRFLEQQQVCTDRICDMMQKFIDKL